MRLLLTGEAVTATEASALGLLSELVDAGAALDAALALARKIAAMPPLAVRAIKDSVRQGAEAPLSVALDYERRRFEALFGTLDQKEGMQAFLGKRSPVFRGR